MSEFSRNLAFIIGINQYGYGIDPLHNAVNDAKQLSNVLREKHGYQVRERLDQHATLNALNDFLENELPNWVTQDDRLLFYFAGHGIALNDDDNPAGYLIPQDAKQGDVQTYLPMTRLQSALEQLPCRHFLGILDCCFAGAFRWGSTRDLLAAPEVVHQERYDRFVQDPAWQIVTSAASDQKALDAFALDTERGLGDHSPFASALIKALSGEADRYPPSTPGKQAGDGIVTATELYLYLRDQVELATESRRQRQTPGIWSLKKHDKGEYIFLTPNHPLNLPPAPPLNESQNPYRGLESFEAKHKDLFFGRTEIVEQLQEFVANHLLTIVLGASGSGKSSLVKAGLIPKLEDASETKWTTIVIRPGKSVYTALNMALGREAASQEPYISLISDWKKQNPDSKLLLVIDQCEELITLCQDDQERHRFLNELEKIIAAYFEIVKVVLTIRSDFEPQLRDLALKDRWQSARFIVPGMSRSQLREAIEKPAEARVMFFQPYELVEQLIDEVADTPGGLPLLSFALSELYLKYLKRQREASYRGETLDRAIIQADYDDLGGVTRSLTQRADQEFNALGNAYEQTIKTVMPRMVAIGGGELARRRVYWSELTYPPAKAEQVNAVITQFSAARLLVEGQDAEGHPTVEPAHDALIQGWARLRDWVNAEKNLDLQRRLTPAAFEWKTKQQKRFLWNANPYLDVLQKEVFNSSDHNWLNQVETEFVQRSVQQKQRNMQTRWGIAIAVILGLVGLTFYASSKQRDAMIGQMVADGQSAEANLRGGQLTLDALLSSLRAGKSLQNLLRQGVFMPGKEQQTQIVRTLRKATYTVKESNRFDGFSGDIKQLFWNNNQLLIVSSERRGTVRILNNQAQPLATLPEDEDSVSQIQFSPDGKTLAIALTNGKIQLWQWEANPAKNPVEWQAHPAQPNQTAIAQIQFSPDGNQLASLGADNTARLWNLSGNQQASDFKQPKWNSSNSTQQSKQPKFIGIGYDDRGQLLRVSTLGKTKGVCVISPTGKRQGEVDLGTIPNSPPNADDIRNAFLSPDGKQVVIQGGDKRENRAFTVLWSPGSGEAKVLSDKPIAFSKSGMLASLESNESIARLDDGTELKGHGSSIVNLGFRADNRQVATASTDGTVRIWSLEPEKVRFVKPLEGTVHTVVFDPKKQQVITQTTDGILHWFDFSGKPVSSNQTPYKLFSSLAVRPDGQGIVAIAQDKTLNSFDASGKFLKAFDGQYEPSSGISFRQDGGAFAVVADHQIMELETTGNPIKTFKVDKDTTVSKLIWRPQNDQLLYSTNSAFDGRVIRLMDVTSNRQYATTFPKPGRGEFTGINFNQDGSVLAGGDATGEVNLLYLEGVQLAELKADDDAIATVSISPDGAMLVTVDKNGAAKLWQIGGLDDLMKRGCDRIRPYLQHPKANLSPDDRKLCD